MQGCLKQQNLNKTFYNSQLFNVVIASILVLIFFSRVKMSNQKLKTKKQMST